ncbi:MAG: hypothetical protein HQK67_08925, partial [Desulfamplus sp.]|nr:hypothetical protein [Desulfamplus sp.]
QQTYYGIIEPFYDDNSNKYKDKSEDNDNDNILDTGEDTNNNNVLDQEDFKWVLPGEYTATVPKSNLIDVTNSVVKSDKTISGITDVSTWDDMMKKIDDTVPLDGGGWYMNFTQKPLKERNISQATLLEGLLTFTTYMPSYNLCTVEEGESNLYALYYKTGTAYYEEALLKANGEHTSTSDGAGKEIMAKMIPLGKGLAGTPNIHVGEDEGSKAFIQTSTGDIITIKELNPHKTQSGITSWKLGDGDQHE